MSVPSFRVRWMTGVAVVGVGPHAAGEPLPPGVGLVEHCKGSRGIILDLVGCSLLTSELIGFLIHAHRAAQAGQHRLRLCCPTELVSEALSIVRLDRVLPIFETLAEALADIEPPTA